MPPRYGFERTFLPLRRGAGTSASRSVCAGGLDLFLDSLDVVAQVQVASDDDRVHEPGDRGAAGWADEVDPEAVPRVANHVGCERAGRVDRRAAERDRR